MKTVRLVSTRTRLPLEINWGGTVYTWTAVGSEVSVPDDLSAMLVEQNPFGVFQVVS